MNPLSVDQEVLERARVSRDSRFDGKFFVGVKTTGIYCRPICPVRLPRSENVTFFPSAAAAQQKGYRPCLRCRPEVAPDSPAWRGSSALVSRALRLISQGGLDEKSGEEFAERLGVTARHLRRLFKLHLGASPGAVAQTRRIHFAKRLLDETILSMTEVALAAGFGSIRRFNSAMQEVYGRTPSELRDRAGCNQSDSGAGALELRLPYRPPFDWDWFLNFLASRTIPGVETVLPDEGVYRRTIVLDQIPGLVEVRNQLETSCLLLRIIHPTTRAIHPIVERIRRVFDLSADPEEVNNHLAATADSWLADSLARTPGLRLPGGWDPFEIAVRAVLGQQVSVAAARTLAGRLVEQVGVRFGDPQGILTHLFPGPEAVAEAGELRIGLPSARERTLRELARRVAEGRVAFDAEAKVVKNQLVAIPGIGPWTADYVCMRALSDPDAFPSTDLGIWNALGRERSQAENLGDCRSLETLAILRRIASLEFTID